MAENRGQTHEAAPVTVCIPWYFVSLDNNCQGKDLKTFSEDANKSSLKHRGALTQSLALLRMFFEIFGARPVIRTSPGPRPSLRCGRVREEPGRACAHPQTAAQPYSNSFILTAASQPRTSHHPFHLSEDSEEHLTQNIPIWAPRSRDHVSCCVLTALPLCNRPLHHVCTNMDQVFKTRKIFPKTLHCFWSKNICIHTMP